MERVRGINRPAVTVAAIILSLAALPALARSAGAYDTQTCRSLHGRMVCSGADWSAATAGTRPYERWQDGSPALSSGTSSDPYRFPHYLGGHNAWYGFGR